MASRNEKQLRLAFKSMQGKIPSIALSKQALKEIALELYSDLDTPTSLGLWMALKANDWKTVVSHEIHAIHFTERDKDLFSRSYQACAFLRKMAFPVDGLDPDATARASFAQCEEQCRKSNRLLRSYRSDPQCGQLVNVVLHYMIRDISAILGGFDPSVWVLSCRFGPGAVVGSSGPDVHNKIGTNPVCTSGFARLGRSIITSIPCWRDAISNTCSDFSDSLAREAEYSLEVDVAQGGKYTQVPKSAKTNRNIEIQPNINAYAQLGLGSMIRERLKRAGLDIDTQASRNAEMAKRGSIDGSLATIDLANASDTLCYELISEVIPSRWFHAMDITRTTHAMDGTEPIRLERFSSMGNGYTFELETLIFWAVVRACRVIADDTEEYGVFGDDIICSAQVAKLVLEVLPALGFTVNQAKSFTTSGFRESCGSDYFFGKPVRPYFFKKGENNSDLQAIISLANGLRRAARRSNRNSGCCARYRGAWLHCLRRIPRDIRLALMGPWSDQDRWLISCADEWHANPHVYLDRKLWSWQIPSLRASSKKSCVASYTAGKAAMLYSLEQASLMKTSDEVYTLEERSLRRSEFFAVPVRWGVELTLDVTTLELNHDFTLWV